MKRIYAFLVALLLMLSLSAAAENMLSVVPATTTNLRAEPVKGSLMMKFVTPRDVLVYTGVSVYDEVGALWHCVELGDDTAWLAAEGGAVLLNGEELHNGAFVRTTGTVNLRADTTVGADIVMIADPGSEFFFLGDTYVDSQGYDWYMISCENGVAWVTSRHAELINEAE